MSVATRFNESDGNRGGDYLKWRKPGGGLFKVFFLLSCGTAREPHVRLSGEFTAHTARGEKI
jgi:hypothetical protein